MKPAHRFTLAMFFALVVGCSNWDAEKAPAGFAIIREHTISAPSNDPPIFSRLDYTVIEIDGKPVTRETLPAWVDMQRGALVPTGRHEFKALVSPHVRLPNHRSAEALFTADVQSTKVYYLVDKDSQPTLIEVKSRQP